MGSPAIVIVAPQRLDPSPHGGQRPAQVCLQVLELLQGVSLRFPDRLVGSGLGFAHGLLGQAVRPAQHLVVLHCRLRPLVGLAQNPARLCMCFGDQPLLLLDSPVGLLDLLGQVESKLVDHLHQLLLVDHHLVGEGDVTGVVDNELKAVKDLVDLQLNLSSRRLATAGGTKSLTSRPWLAMSLRIDDDTKM